MTSPRPAVLRASDYSSNATNSLIHLYRAESAKMISYRQRLDQTTNWAVVTTAGLGSLAFGNGAHSHVIFLFAMGTNFYFLRLEARRFRNYEIAHHRVRIMERFFFPVMLGETVDGGWQQFLLAEIAKPRSPITIKEALGWRLKRNYLWIYLGVLAAWLGKLASTYPVGVPFRLPLFVEQAHIGSISGWIVFGAVAVFYGFLISLASSASRRYPLEDD